MKSALFIIAQNNFQDQEFSEPRRILESKGFKVIVASKTSSEAKGAFGLKIKPNMDVASALDNIDSDINSYSAIVFVGGGGAASYFDDLTALEIARRMYDNRKVVAAICIGPIILANAGILKGKNATVWPSESKTLTSKGAIYLDKPVVVDGNIVTANGPNAAVEFGNVIAKLLI